VPETQLWADAEELRKLLDYAERSSNP
jgi:hypothetical protein